MGSAAPPPLHPINLPNHSLIRNASSSTAFAPESHGESHRVSSKPTDSHRAKYATTPGCR